MRRNPSSSSESVAISLPSLASILQTTDPLFPIGSYAHSFGLEQFCLDHEVADADSLQSYIANLIFQNLEHFELPYLRFAYEAIASERFDTLCEIDEEVAASKPSKEIRSASASQGQQRLRLLSKLRPSPRFERLLFLKKEKRIVPHHLVVFATEYADLEIPLDAALASWAYQTIAAPCAAALKLFRIGQEGVQSVLTNSLQDIERLVKTSLEVEREFAGTFLPMLDIASQRHERAFARLFIS